MTRAAVLDGVLTHKGGIGAAVIVILLVAFGQLETLELLSLGKLFQVRGPRPPTAPIVIVTIDESSVNELQEQWPFPRAMHGQLIEKISAGRPLVIGVDVLFDLPSLRGQADDEALARAVAAAGNVVLAMAAANDDQPEAGDKLGIGYKREVINLPIPAIRAGAASVAALNMTPDADGHIRRVPLRLFAIGGWHPTFDAELYRLARQAKLPAAPLPRGDSVLINFRGGPKTFRWVPYYQVIKDEVPPEVFRDKIVLVGTTSEVQHDQFPTAFAPAGDMPGVEIHANALETFVRGNAIREIPQWVSTILAVVAGLLGSALVVRLHAVRALIAAALLWATLTACAYIGFVVTDTWMRGMAGTLALVLGYGATVVENFIREQREKRRLSQFFSPDVLKHVVRHTDGVTLASSRRLVTVLFSDIRGFTSMSERLQPEEVAEMLKEYLTEMTEVVFRHGGTVDKYIGDCIMALYNVPFEDRDHALNAIRTGLEFQERTLAVSRKWEEKLGVRIRNGVGINTGEAVVGTLGSRQRLEYTAIGDAINLASRLESITKDYGASIIISEFTYQYVQGQFLTRQLGAVTVKGKTQPVKIYAVLAQDIRKSPRVPVAAEATLVATDGAGGCTVEVQNLSEDGLALRGLPEEWSKGRAVQVRCEMGGLPKPIVAEGSIVWRLDDFAGLAFTAIDPEGATAIRDYVTGSTRQAGATAAL